jgi:transcriptional regulator with XRE-family HTH domain
MSKRQERLIELVVTERTRRGIRQNALARRLRQPQSAISRLESGQRRIEVIEFIELAEAIGFSPSQALRKIQAAR